MKRSGLLLLVLVIPALMNSCSKDRRLERRLHSKEGKWNIESLFQGNYESGELINSVSQDEAGFIVFEKNGSVMINLPVNNQYAAIGGTWSNTSDKVMIATAGQGLIFEVSEESKNKMTLTSKVNYNDSVYSTTIFKIRKEK